MYNGPPPWVPEKYTRPIVGVETQHDGHTVEDSSVFVGTSALICLITVTITDKLFSISSAKKDNSVVMHGRYKLRFGSC
jgi:hypothetical protein